MELTLRNIFSILDGMNGIELLVLLALFAITLSIFEAIFFKKKPKYEITDPFMQLFYIELKNNCSYDEKIVLYRNAPLVIKKNYIDFVKDVIFNKGV
jgi:hypothetical protein